MTDDDIIERALTILESRLQKAGYAVTGTELASTYLKMHLAGLEYESFRVMFLNAQHELISFREMFRGTIDGASVYPREVVKAALHFNAAAVILSHNHPSGNPQPSQADRNITERLVDALQLVDIRVLDHIVVGGNKTCSFAEAGMM
ncbi:MAG: JAB domain-containing protein [Neptuniibacter sp.]